MQLWKEKQTLIKKYMGNNIRKRRIINEFMSFEHNLQPMNIETDDEVLERDIVMEHTQIFPDFDNNILADDPFGRKRSNVMLKDSTFPLSKPEFSFLCHPDPPLEAYRSRNLMPIHYHTENIEKLEEVLVNKLGLKRMSKEIVQERNRMIQKQLGKHSDRHSMHEEKSVFLKKKNSLKIVDSKIFKFETKDDLSPDSLRIPEPKKAKILPKKSLEHPLSSIKES